LNDFLHEFRESLSLELCPFGQIVNHAAVKINFNLVPILDAFGCLRTFDDGKPDIDRIPVKDSRKGFRDDTAYPCRLDGDGGMFPGGAAAEVLLCHDDIPFVYLMDELLINVLHAMGGKLCRI